jgi:hypothetical protein
MIQENNLPALKMWNIFFAVIRPAGRSGVR